MLDESRRSQLDSIVQQATQNGEAPETIQSIVDDFKSKYDVQSAPASLGSKIVSNLTPLQSAIGAGGDVSRLIGGESVKNITDNPSSTQNNQASPFNTAIVAANTIGGPVYQHAAALTNNALGGFKDPYSKSFQDVQQNINQAESDNVANLMGTTVGAAAPFGLPSVVFEGVNTAVKPMNAFTRALTSGLSNVLYGQTILDPKTNPEDRAVAGLGQFAAGAGTQASLDVISKGLDYYANKKAANLLRLPSVKEGKRVIESRGIFPAASRDSMLEKANQKASETWGKLSEIYKNNPILTRWSEVSEAKPAQLARLLKAPLDLENVGKPFSPDVPIEGKPLTEAINKVKSGVALSQVDLHTIKSALGEQVYYNRSGRDLRANSATGDLQDKIRSLIGEKLIELNPDQPVAKLNYDYGTAKKVSNAINGINSKNARDSLGDALKHAAIDSIFAGSVAHGLGASNSQAALAVAGANLGRQVAKTTPIGSSLAYTANKLSKSLKIDPEASRYLLMLAPKLGDAVMPQDKTNKAE